MIRDIIVLTQEETDIPSIMLHPLTSAVRSTLAPERNGAENEREKRNIHLHLYIQCIHIWQCDSSAGCIFLEKKVEQEKNREKGEYISILLLSWAFSLFFSTTYSYSRFFSQQESHYRILMLTKLDPVQLCTHYTFKITLQVQKHNPCSSFIHSLSSLDTMKWE